MKIKEVQKTSQGKLTARVSMELIVQCLVLGGEEPSGIAPSALDFGVNRYMRL